MLNRMLTFDMSSENGIVVDSGNRASVTDIYDTMMMLKGCPYGVNAEVSIEKVYKKPIGATACWLF